MDANVAAAFLSGGLDGTLEAAKRFDFPFGDLFSWDEMYKTHQAIGIGQTVGIIPPDTLQNIAMAEAEL